MIFENYYLECLSQASYLIADEQTKSAVIIDPQRDIEIYLDDLKEKGLNLKYVFETHIHADFLSGHLELANKTGAQIVFGEKAKGRLGFDSLYAKDGELFALSDDGVHLGVIETPGHTPESITIALFSQKPEVYATGSYGSPEKIFTGDTLFIGDVGRPDLLGGVGLSAQEMASELYDTLHQKLLTLPDETLVFPAHGAGSACGKSLSSERSDSLGAQRKTNYALQAMTKEEFIELVTEGQPLTPQYFSHSVEMNSSAHQLLDENKTCPTIDFTRAEKEIRDGAVLVDTREPTDFSLGHIKGSINIGLDGRFAETVGQVLSPEAKIILTGEPDHIQEAYVRLARIGYDNCVGSINNLFDILETKPELVQTSTRIEARSITSPQIDNVNKLQIVDVRTPIEVEDGMYETAKSIPLARLHEKIGELDPNRPVIVYCAGGWRSSVAASYLKSKGFENVSDVIGGYNALKLMSV